MLETEHNHDLGDDRSMIAAAGAPVAAAGGAGVCSSSRNSTGAGVGNNNNNNNITINGNGGDNLPNHGPVVLLDGHRMKSLDDVMRVGSVVVDGEVDNCASAAAGASVTPPSPTFSAVAGGLLVSAGPSSRCISTRCTPTAELLRLDEAYAESAAAESVAVVTSAAATAASAAVANSSSSSSGAKGDTVGLTAAVGVEPALMYGGGGDGSLGNGFHEPHQEQHNHHTYQYPQPHPHHESYQQLYQHQQQPSQQHMSYQYQHQHLYHPHPHPHLHHEQTW